jgi:hypothetical protein
LFDFSLGVSENLVSALIVAILSVLALLGLSRRRTRHLGAFFGLGSGTRRILIMLPRFQPMAETTALPDGEQSVGYTEETVTATEFQGALVLRDLLDSKWLIGSLGALAEGLFTGQLALGRVSVSILPVSQVEWERERERERGPVILMGAGANKSNSISEIYLGGDDKRSAYRFVKHGGERAFERIAAHGYASGIYYAKSYWPAELVLIQRHKGADGMVVFLCAGKNVSGSRIAAEFLARNWNDLYGEFGGSSGGNFARLYTFSGSADEYQIVDTVKF